MKILPTLQHWHSFKLSVLHRIFIQFQSPDVYVLSKKSFRLEAEKRIKDSLGGNILEVSTIFSGFFRPGPYPHCCILGEAWPEREIEILARARPEREIKISTRARPEKEIETSVRARPGRRVKLKFRPMSGPTIFFPDFCPDHLDLSDFKTGLFSCLQIINVLFCR